SHDLAHQRALDAVTVAAGSENADDPASGQVTRGPERGLQRAGRVRVVDEHGERLSLLHRIESPRHTVYRFDALLDRSLGDPERARGSCRCERILHVEASLQLELDSVELVLRVE